MKPWRNYKESLREDLKDPEEAAGYLTAALEEGDYRFFLIALRNVAEAQGGLLRLSRKTKLSRPNLYRMLSKAGRPEIHSLYHILKSLGLQFSVSASKNIHFKKAA